MSSVTQCQSSEHYCDTLTICFEKYGKPHQIHTDNGGPFVSAGKFYDFLNVLYKSDLIIPQYLKKKIFF